MKQYVIYYRREGSGQMIQLKPEMDGNTYTCEPVRHAVDHIRRHEFVEGVSVKDGQKYFSIMAFTAEKRTPSSFSMDDELHINKPIDAIALLRAAGLTVPDGIVDPTGPCECGAATICTHDCSIHGHNGPAGVDGSDEEEEQEPPIMATSKDGLTTLWLFQP